MRVKNYHLKRYADGSREIILSEDSHSEVMTFAKDDAMDFMATVDQLRNEKPIYYRDGLLTTEPQPVGSWRR